MKKKVLSLLLASAMVVSLAACGSTSSGSASSSTEAAQSETTESEAAETEQAAAVAQTEATSSDVESAHVDVVNIASERDPTDMGPWAGNMGGASAIVPLVYQTLEIMELNGEPESCLAKTVTQVDDYTYDVELYDYITDSLGNNLTANDIAFGVEEAKSIGKVASVKVVDSIDVTGDYTFTVHFTDAFSMGDEEGFFCQTFWVTQAAYEADGNKMAQHPVGTAAYEMTNYVGGSVITFEARDDYWQTDASLIARSSEAHADTINFQIITEAAQRAIAIENGSLDYGGVSTSDRERLESEGYDMVAVPDNLTFMLFANMDESTITGKSTELRQAIFYALDNQSISDLITSFTSVPVYDLSNSNYPDYYGDTYKNQDDYYQYDAEKAAQLLQDAGYNGETIKLICNSDEAVTEVAEIVKSFLEAVGVTVEIEAYQGNMMSDVSSDPANWDLYLLQYASTDYSVNVWEKVLNKAKYSWGGTLNFDMDEELQTKLAECRTVAGHTEENVVALHNYIVENALACGLVQGINYYATSSKIDADNVVFSDQRIIRPNATIYKAE